MELLRNIGGVVAVTGSDDGGESQVFFREIYDHKQPEMHLIHLTSLRCFHHGCFNLQGGLEAKESSCGPTETPKPFNRAF